MYVPDPQPHLSLATVVIVNGQSDNMGGCYRRVVLTGPIAGMIGIVLCRGGNGMAVTVLLGTQLLAVPESHVLSLCPYHQHQLSAKTNLIVSY